MFYEKLAQAKQEKTAMDFGVRYNINHARDAHMRELMTRAAIRKR